MLLDLARPVLRGSVRSASVSTHRCREGGPCRLARQDRKIGRLERKWKTDQTPAGLVPAGESDCPAIAAESRSPAGRAGRGLKVFCVPTSSRSISSPAARGGKGSLDRRSPERRGARKWQPSGPHPARETFGRDRGGVRRPAPNSRSANQVAAPTGLSVNSRSA